MNIIPCIVLLLLNTLSCNAMEQEKPDKKKVLEKRKEPSPASSPSVSPQSSPFQTHGRTHKPSFSGFSDRSASISSASSISGSSSQSSSVVSTPRVDSIDSDSADSPETPTKKPKLLFKKATQTLTEAARILTEDDAKQRASSEELRIDTPELGLQAIPGQLSQLPFSQELEESSFYSPTAPITKSFQNFNLTSSTSMTSESLPSLPAAAAVVVSQQKHGAQEEKKKRVAGKKSPDSDDDTDLMKAIFDREKAEVRTLIKNKADVNARNKAGQTALHYAVCPADMADDKIIVAIVNLLLDAKADVTLKYDDQTAYEIALGSLKKGPIVELLKEKSGISKSAAS